MPRHRELDYIPTDLITKYLDLLWANTVPYSCRNLKPFPEMKRLGLKDKYPTPSRVEVKSLGLCPFLFMPSWLVFRKHHFSRTQCNKRSIERKLGSQLRPSTEYTNANLAFDVTKFVAISSISRKQVLHSYATERVYYLFCPQQGYYKVQVVLAVLIAEGSGFDLRQCFGVQYICFL